MAKVKKQHYVPQFYLKQWNNEKSNEQIYVFDKQLKKSFSSNIKGIASSNYFYDFPELNKEQKKEFIKRIFKEKSLSEEEKNKVIDYLDKQIIEKSLSEIESINSQIIINLLKKLENLKSLISYCSRHEFISFKEKLELSFFIALQYCRTEEMRVVNKQINEKFIKHIYNFLLSNISKLKKDKELINSIGKNEFDSLLDSIKNGIINSNSFEINLDENYIKITHLLSMYEHSEVISKILLKYKWFICINNTTLPFFTTDNPVIKKANLSNPFYSNGFASKGIEIFYPINPKYAILIVEPSYYQELIPFILNNTILNLEESNVIHYNDLLIQNATSQIYSNIDNFKWVEKRLHDTPKIAEKYRKRIS